MTINIGDNLHLHNPWTNRQSEKWRTMPITKITTQSYICGEGHGEIKVRKSDMTYNAGNYRCVAFTDQGKEDRIWYDENRRRIAKEVEGADVATLRAVDALLKSTGG